MTEEIKHINEKNQEYIAEGNRMTEKIIKEEFDKAFKKYFSEAIIIDGVNVAGCEFYLQDEKYSCDLSFINKKELCKCDDVQDCTYKQLKRLEQENKELKKTKGKCAFKSLDNTFCDEARIKIDKLELDKDCLNASLETARKYRGIAEVERDNYRSALEEIREIAKDIIENDVYENSDVKAENILTKINEVLQ